MFKPIIIALVVHAVIISLVWVGFSIPMPRNEVEFFDSGSSVLVEDLPQIKTPLIIRAHEGSMFVPWLQIRDLNKPKR